MAEVLEGPAGLAGREVLALFVAILSRLHCLIWPHDSILIVAGERREHDTCLQDVSEDGRRGSCD